MFEFLLNMWRNAAATVSQDVRDFVLAMVRNTYSYLHDLFHSEIGAMEDFYNATNSLAGGQRDFAAGTVHAFGNINRIRFPYTWNWLRWLGGKTRKDLQDAVIVLQRQMVAGDARQHAYTRSVLLWILVHVLKFLLGLVTRALMWIAGNGSHMWYYFTHLLDFAELLIFHLVTSLEKHAWDIAKMLGEFLLALIVHNMVRFAKLVEDIVVAVL